MSSSEVDDASGEAAVQDDTGFTLKEGSNGLGVGIFLSFSCVISLCAAAALPGLRLHVWAHLETS